MCFREQDIVHLKIHFITRDHYPGTTFHEFTLAAVARQFGLRRTAQLAELSDERRHALARAVIERLPQTHRPRSLRVAPATGRAAVA